jgi:hypothetical protein
MWGWLNFIYSTDILHQPPRKVQKNFSEDNRYPGRGMNSGHPEHEAVLPFRKLHLLVLCSALKDSKPSTDTMIETELVEGSLSTMEH